MVKLSVLMAVYNGERFLKEGIDSILNQTFGDYEFLIIDDGSQDCTKDIILSYRDKRILFVQNKKNLGQMESLNIGIKLSRGQYIARIDYDDISLPKRFEKEIEILDRFHDIALVYSNSFIIDARGIRRDKTYFDHAKPYRWFVFDKLLRRNFIAIGTVMMRRAIFREIGLFNPTYRIAAEYDLLLRLTQRYKVNFIDEILAGYRVHRKNSCLDTERTTKENIEILTNFDRHTLEKNQEAILNKMISWWIASLAMHFLFQYNRELCKAKAIESLGINPFNPKAFAAIFTATFFPKVLIDYVGSFRRGWFE